MRKAGLGCMTWTGLGAGQRQFVVNRGMHGPQSHKKISRASAAAAAFVLAIAVVTSAGAQTIREPNPPKKSTQPSAAAKSLPTGREKSCAMYGAGFVRVPASDTCIKIGGSVEIDGTVSRGR